MNRNPGDVQSFVCYFTYTVKDIRGEILHTRKDLEVYIFPDALDWYGEAQTIYILPVSKFECNLLYLPGYDQTGNLCACACHITAFTTIFMPHLQV